MHSFFTVHILVNLLKTIYLKRSLSLRVFGRARVVVWQGRPVPAQLESYIGASSRAACSASHLTPY